MRFIIPLVLFVLIAIFLGIGLNLNPREVPSPLIGKPAPEFNLPSLKIAEKMVKPSDFKGKVWLLNVWATWCASCRAEHAALVEFGKRNIAPIIGLNYKDDAEAAKQWLINLGDPYMINAFDKDGRVAIDWGVYGAPETYIIDQQGLVQYKHIGPVDPKVLEEKIIPLIQKLQSQA